MKLKKNLTLIAALSCLLMAGCNNSPAENTNPTTAPKATLPTVILQPFGNIEKTVLYEEGRISFKALRLTTVADGAEVVVEIQNKSNRPICIAADDLIVNGITVTDGFSIEASVGATVESCIRLSRSSLTDAYIGNIVTLEGCDVRLFETEEFQTLDTFSFKLTTSVQYEQTFPEAGTEIYNENGLTVKALPYLTSADGTTLRILVTNDTDASVNLRCEKATVDGKEVTAFVYDTVYPGTSRYCTVHIDTIVQEGVSARLRIHDLTKEQAVIAELDSFTFFPL